MANIVLARHLMRYDAIRYIYVRSEADGSQFIYRMEHWDEAYNVLNETGK